MTTSIFDTAAAWAAFEARDRSCDGRFVAAVLTTGIYCRPSCPARRAKRENVRFFAAAHDAAAAGFRACRRCQPETVSRDREAVNRALALLASDPPPRLDALAGAVGYTPSHFQRLFVREVGVSPAAYARALRARRAEAALATSDSVTAALYEAGYEGPSRFYDEAGRRLGMTPSAWRDGGRGETIRFVLADSSAGPLCIAATARGVCAMIFDGDEAALRRRFPNATLVPDDGTIAPWVEAALAQVECPGAHDLPLDVVGTVFQEKVWAALRAIPPGETRSYAEIAAAIGHPGATRAVGTANGQNPVAVLVPCHRVIRSDGSLGGYAGGIERKIRLLEAENSLPTLL